MRSFTSDASSQIAKALRQYSTSQNHPIVHYKCFVHRLRTIYKQIKNIKLTSCPKAYDKKLYCQKLASCIRAWIRLELVRQRSQCTNDDVFVQYSKTAINNILHCFQGQHTMCRSRSMVCCAHLASYSTKFLPYGKHLQLSMSDINKLQAKMDTLCSQENLKQMSKLSTTNKAESLHHRVFTYAPKNTVWSRNFSGLCNSAAHSSSLGSGQSTIYLAKHIGIKVKSQDPFYRAIKQN